MTLTALISARFTLRPSDFRPWLSQPCSLRIASDSCHARYPDSLNQLDSRRGTAPNKQRIHGHHRNSEPRISLRSSGNQEKVNDGEHKKVAQISFTSEPIPASNKC